MADFIESLSVLIKNLNELLVNYPEAWELLIVLFKFLMYVYVAKYLFLLIKYLLDKFLADMPYIYAKENKKEKWNK